MATNREKAIKSWLENWKNKKYRAMLDFSQISWVNADYIVKGIPQDVGLYIKNLYKNTELLDFEILTTHTVKYKGKDKVESLDEKIIIDYTVACKIYYKGLSIAKDEVRLIRMIQETKDGKGTPTKGKWGVNPMSALRKVDYDFTNIKKNTKTFEELVVKMRSIIDDMADFKTKENRTK
ncbi:MAG: hypothetical protein WC121_10785 [Candidatus Kapaibacterium sp.]